MWIFKVKTKQNLGMNPNSVKMEKGQRSDTIKTHEGQ